MSVLRGSRSQYIMVSRLITSLIAFLAYIGSARAQAQVWVDVSPNSREIGDVEKRYTPELMKELQSAKDDALLIYTEFTARAGADLKKFLVDISGFTYETVNRIDKQMLNDAPEPCRSAFQKRLKKIEYDAHRAATFSAENHHKFFLGHLIVFKMHLNKSEDFINKCEKIIKTCGIDCEATPRVVRWRRHAADEINRVRDDIQHSRKYYRDILLHSMRRLRHLRRQALARADEAIIELQTCARG